MKVKGCPGLVKGYAILASAVSLLVAGVAVGQENSPETGQTRISLEEKHSNWTAVCETNGEIEACGILYVVTDSKEGFQIARISIVPTPSDSEFAARAIVHTPLGSNLRRGVGLRVDGRKATTHGFEFCLADGCVARIGLAQSRVNEMARGRMMRMILYYGDRVNEPLNYDISLIGFTSAIKAISNR